MKNTTHLELGTDLGDYIIEEVIATGGMGAIYRAKEKSLGRQVAIKTIKHELLNQVKICERFQNEAKIIAQLNHQNIVIIHSFVKGDDFDYIVLELIDGKTLQDIIENDPINIDLASEMMRQVLNGLKIAHDKDVLHRDIKPANIMLDKNERVKILDFGLAKSIDLSHDSFTTAGTIMGTTYYLSPEVAIGNKPIKASDIYSAGIVFYELVTGKLPFQADTPLGTIEKIKTERLPSPETINPQVPTYLSNIISKMCQKKPQDRYLNIDEILTDLKTKAQVTEPISPKHENAQIKTSQIISSMGFEPLEVDEILTLAKDLQIKKQNSLGQSTIISIGEELHLDEDIIREATKRFKEKGEKNKKAEPADFIKDFFESNNDTCGNPDEFKKASTSSRAIALLIDFIVLSVIGISTFGIGMLFYVPICHHLLKGQTLGQKANNLLTITTDNKPLTFEKSLIDSIGMFFLPFDILIGIFCSSNTNHFQRFMQTIANTAVVQEKKDP